MFTKNKRKWINCLSTLAITVAMIFTAVPINYITVQAENKVQDIQKLLYNCV